MLDCIVFFANMWQYLCTFSAYLSIIAKEEEAGIIVENMVDREQITTLPAQ